MTLNDIIIWRAEDLSTEKRKQYNLSTTGMIIIEIHKTHNMKLPEKIISIDQKGGMSAYLRSLAPFKEVEISHSPEQGGKII